MMIKTIMVILMQKIKLLMQKMITGKEQETPQEEMIMVMRILIQINVIQNLKRNQHKVQEDSAHAKNNHWFNGLCGKHHIQFC